MDSLIHRAKHVHSLHVVNIGLQAFLTMLIIVHGANHMHSMRVVSIVLQTYKTMFDLLHGANHVSLIHLYLCIHV